MYLGYQDNKIKLYVEEPLSSKFYPVDEWVETQDEYVIEGDEYVIKDSAWEARERVRERERLDNLKLTPSDVERVLLKVKGWNFEDLKNFLREEGYTDIQIKAIDIELRANNFFRGATIGEEPNKIRIVDTIGELLGYTSEDMDYLFTYKELPMKE